MAAASSGKSKAVELLLPKADPTISATNGYTPLIAAAEGGDKATVQALLDRDLDPNAVTTDGWTASNSAWTAA